MDTLYDAHLFSEFFDDQPQAVIWMRPLFKGTDGPPVDFEYVYCNEEGARYLNLSCNRVRGLRISTTPTLSDDLRRNVFAEVLGVYQRGKRSWSRLYNPVIDKYANVVRFPFRGGVLSVIQDITEESHSIQELERQRVLAGSILDASPNGIFVAKVRLGGSGEVLDFALDRVNPACARLLGRDGERVRGASCLQLFPEALYPGLFAQHLRVFKTGKSESREVHCRLGHRDAWFQVTSVKLDSGVLVTFSEVTAQKQAAQLVEEQRRLLENILKHSSGGIVVGEAVRDQEGNIRDLRIVMANDAAIRLVGIPREIYLSQTAAHLHQDVWESQFLDLNTEALQSGRTLHTELFWQLTQKWLEVTLSRLTGDQLIFVLSDITTQKQTRLQLERTVEELQRSNASLQEFAYAASHDLQEPLRKIQLFSERLRQGLTTAVPEENSQLLERMENAASRMRTLIDDLLAFSQVSMKPGLLQPVDLNGVVREVLHDLETAIQQSGAHLQIDPLPEVRGDERQLRQLFQNLLGNALKYRNKEVSPRITLRYRPVREGDTSAPLLQDSCAGSCRLIEVGDNGIGFDPQEAEKIFQLFHRLQGRLDYPGTGIGLAIVHKVAVNHNGAVWAQGEPGKGATFSLLLPA
ncbi:ATP-binding protein [Paraflavisolibacter sp. H34]|uniref:sensor histidine kinase n=1 Tax=Huijunlia imazamoxiresistens TaxID=3127457 RepID=UPI003016924F